MQLLVIEDETKLAQYLHKGLREEGFAVDVAHDGVTGLEAALQHAYDLVVLDGMLPGLDGFAVLAALRQSRQTPVLMLTARGEVMDRVVGLELGADDYIPKPFEPRELVARVQTVLRRRVAPAAPADDARLRFEGLEIDPVTRSVWRGGQALELTGTEFELLQLLAREPGRVWSRDDILNQLRGHEAELYTRAVDIVISRLRKKLEPLDAIKTLRNAGYALALAPRPGRG